MRVTADLGLCQGHQMCQGEAPDVFGFDEDADLVVVLQEHPDESLRPQVQAAVKYCPAMALGLDELDRRAPLDQRAPLDRRAPLDQRRKDADD